MKNKLQVFNCVMSVSLAVVGLLTGLFMLLRIQGLEIHNNLSVGMSINDVASRLGQPDRISEKGKELDPPHATGFVPDMKDFETAYTYFWSVNKVVYVFFDANGRVITYYVCGV